MSAVKKNKRRKGGIRRLLDIIGATSLRRRVVVLACVIVGSFVEGFGIASLLPLIAVADGGAQKTKLGHIILKALDSVGLPADPLVLVSVLVVGMLLKAGFLVIAMHQVGHAVAEVATRLRLELIESVFAARWSFYVHQPFGRFANALGIEATRASEAYNSSAMFMSNVFQAIVYLAVAALMSWQLALVALAIGLGMVLSLNRLLVAARRSSRKQTQKLKSLVSRLADVLIGIKPMKAMARQARFNSLFTADIQQINHFVRKIMFSRHMNRVLQEPILAICLAVGIYVTLVVLHISVQEVVVASLLLAKTVSTIGRAQQDFQSMEISGAGFAAISHAIAEAREAKEVNEGTVVPVLEREIGLRNVRFSFGEKCILDDVSLTIPARAVTSITGESGAGKTTLVDLILGLHEPQSGAIVIDGVPLSQIDRMRWRSMIGYVPQELILFHDTIMANITLGEETFSRADVEAALRDAGAWDFVCRLPDGMDHVVGERGSTLSGGQRQRIALARALVHRPRLLILDEVTSALDPATETVIVQNIIDLAHRHGITVLAITHQRAWTEIADIVWRVEGGKVRSVSERAVVRALG